MHGDIDEDRNDEHKYEHGDGLRHEPKQLERKPDREGQYLQQRPHPLDGALLTLRLVFRLNRHEPPCDQIGNDHGNDAGDHGQNDNDESDDGWIGIHMFPDSGADAGNLLVTFGTIELFHIHSFPDMLPTCRKYSNIFPTFQSHSNRFFPIFGGNSKKGVV